jgi:hypothetical protein
MIRIKTRLAKIIGTRPSTLLSVVTNIHLAISGFHTTRNYEWVKPREPKIFKIGHSPARQLLPNHVNVELQVVYRKIKGKG